MIQNSEGHKKMVMKYDEPSMQIIILNTSDMIVTSALGDDPEAELGDQDDW